MGPEAFVLRPWQRPLKVAGHHFHQFPAPRSWGDSPEEWLLSSETSEYIRSAIEKLPAGQRQVITLRDIEG